MALRWPHRRLSGAELNVAVLIASVVGCAAQALVVTLAGLPAASAVGVTVGATFAWAALRYRRAQPLTLLVAVTAGVAAASGIWAVLNSTATRWISVVDSLACPLAVYAVGLALMRVWPAREHQGRDGLHELPASLYTRYMSRQERRRSAR
jgi:hypothetical protein